ncbi:hypothetical protein C0991_001492, partial [Blastosporella zonata]
PYDDSQPALPYSYNDWKRAIISLYPGANAATKYSMADLDQIMGKAARTDIKTIGQFANYYRKFYQVSKWLTDSGRIGSKGTAFSKMAWDPVYGPISNTDSTLSKETSDLEIPTL